MNNNIRIRLTPLSAADNDLTDILGTPPLAYDVQILNSQATVGDYLQALGGFQAQKLSPENQNLSEPADADLAAWLQEWAELHFFGQAIDLRLPRRPNGACRFLEQEQKFCTRHRQRSFTCRTHCCLPKTERAEALRAILINAGEDALVRRLLQMPAEIQPWAERLANCRPDDYAPNAFCRLPMAEWRQAKLQELLPEAEWARLYQPNKN